MIITELLEKNTKMEEAHFDNALQYTRKDTIKISLNSGCPQSNKNWHGLTLIIGEDAPIQVLYCMQSFDGNTIKWTSLDGVECNKLIHGAKIQIYGTLDYSHLTTEAQDYTNELTDKTRSLSSYYIYYTFVIVLQEEASVDPKIFNKYYGFDSKTLVINGVNKIVNNNGVVGFRGEDLGHNTEIKLTDIKTATLISYEM